MPRKPKTVATELKDIPPEAAGDGFGEEETPPQRGHTPSLPAMTGPGVETPKIPALDKLVRKYETAKEKRCAESPGEVAAKKELKFALHQQKESLPVNSDGCRFYRSEEYERDYVLEESLKVKRHDVEDDD